MPVLHFLRHLRVLLKFGADIEATDDLGRKPVECIPEAESFELVPDAQVRYLQSLVVNFTANPYIFLKNKLNRS